MKLDRTYLKILMSINFLWILQWGFEFIDSLINNSEIKIIRFISSIILALAVYSFITLITKYIKLVNENNQHKERGNSYEDNRKVEETSKEKKSN